MHYLVGYADCYGSAFVGSINYHTTDVFVVVVGDVSHSVMADMRFRSPVNNLHRILVDKMG